MDSDNGPFVSRMLAAGLGGVPFVALMTTVSPNSPWWVHTIGAQLIWSATAYVVLKVWPPPDRQGP
jgi:hypothetical protein